MTLTLTLTLTLALALTLALTLTLSLTLTLALTQGLLAQVAAVIEELDLVTVAVPVAATLLLV